MNTARIVPAVLTDSPSELTRMVGLANGFAEFVQIDVMDGEFVPPRSIGADDLEGLDVRFRWEAHLMVSRPLEQMAAFARAGAGRITFHAESADDAHDVVAQARSLGVEVGLAVNPGTAIADVASLLPLVDSLLLLTVEPGYYGSTFLPHVLPKVEAARLACPTVEIGVDGGIKEQNLLQVAATGVDEICVGSAIFRADDPAAAYRRLVSIVYAS